MKKILVAFDGSAGAQLAIKEMIRGGFAEREEAKVVTLADVWLPQNNLTVDQLSAHPDFGATHERAKEALESARKTAADGARLLHEIFPKWTITSESQAESPAWGILAIARKWEAQLIVIGSHGRNILEKIFLGSVSTKVASEAHCSVRIVRPHGPGKNSNGKLLIGIDGSSDSHLAVKEVLSRHWPARTVVHLVSVVDDKMRTSFLKEVASGVASGTLEEKLHRTLVEARVKLEAVGLAAETHTLEGDPKNKVLSLARDLDVEAILLGARGLDHKERLYLGTVASAICSRAHCTVEIVRPHTSQ